jgi:hypothetical protein
MRKTAAVGGVELAELDKQLDRTCAYSRRQAKRFPIVTPDERYWRAEGDWLLGKQAQAVRIWETGLSAAERASMPYQRWRAHKTLADRHPEASEASRHRAKADELQAVVFDTKGGL